MHLDIQIGERLKEERKRLKLSQQAMADGVGVRREMWAKYEAGSEPGAGVLARACDAGVDVVYVLTGKRVSAAVEDQSAMSHGSASVTPLPLNESRLLTQQEVLAIVLDAMYQARKHLPAKSVQALVDTAMQLQRAGLPVNKSALETQLRAVK